MQAPIEAPFEICPSSTAHPESYMIPFPQDVLKDAKENPPARRPNKAIGLVVCCSITCFMAILSGISYWQSATLIPDTLSDESSTPIDGWMDLGMILLDIQSAQTAAQYHVHSNGVYVLAVLENSLAQSAGFRSGDQIILLDTDPVSTTAELNKLLFNDFIRTSAKFTILRNRKEAVLELFLPQSEGKI